MSEKTVAQKLFIRENYRILLLNEPDNYREALGELPKGAVILTEPGQQTDFIQVFVTSMKQLEEQLSELKAYLKPDGLFWVTYPKGTSKIETDVNRDIIWKYAQTIGLRAVSMISVDETWSAMRLRIV